MVNRYTIFLPVRNGGGYLKKCVESILNQTYKKFDLVVLENCSTDGSAEWLSSVDDSRVTILPASSDLNIQSNWQRILEAKKNEYMTMIGHDDLLYPDFLETINDLVERFPNAALYQTHFQFIGENGECVRKCLPMPFRQSAGELLRDILTFRVDSYGTGYVMRSKHYNEAGGIPGFHNLMFADHALWVTLTKRSWKVTATQECFAYRLHSKSTSVVSSGTGYLQGLAQFAQFLEEKAKSDSEIGSVVREHFPGYVFSSHRAVYFTHLYEASKQGRTRDEAVRDSIVLSLEKLQPTLVHKFNTSALIKVLESLNGSYLRVILSSVWDGYRWLRSLIRRGVSAHTCN